MNKILSIVETAPRVVRLEVEAPDVAKHCQPGQFIILRADAEGERVPFTICDYDREKGTITLLVQVVGDTTAEIADWRVT